MEEWEVAPVAPVTPPWSASRKVLLGIAVMLLVTGFFAIFGYYGMGPLARILNPVVEFEPQSVIAPELGTGADPLVIYVAFRWPHEGFCSGEFKVHAVETSTEVHVSAVEDRAVRGACAGLGSDGKWAAALLALSKPLGARQVIRQSDGTRLPVVAQLP